MAALLGKLVRRNGIIFRKNNYANRRTKAQIVKDFQTRKRGDTPARQKCNRVAQFRINDLTPTKANPKETTAVAAC